MVSNTVLIIIVLVCSLSSVSLAAGIFGVVNPDVHMLFSPSIQQKRYMRESKGSCKGSFKVHTPYNENLAKFHDLTLTLIEYYVRQTEDIEDQPDGDSMSEL
ncbi:uncharacterized protein N7483_009297 [Penicillium malachiteum]|uniref:uncharacterized protein n=1 Tax=Penicillium malachiteum TaxID=1324776 RepID=UPI002546FFA5|nr:uncharacterized protein N7483_009297 [Penicillium malachiteum]KAJ5721363.1 hypothetical protein N7483_009297 [Penicillium malachiteum]